MEEPKIIEKEMPFGITGEYDYKTDTIFIKKGLKGFLRREAYYHELTHRKLGWIKIMDNKNIILKNLYIYLFVPLIEEIYVKTISIYLAIKNKKVEVKIK